MSSSFIQQTQNEINSGNDTLNKIAIVKKGLQAHLML